MNILYKDMLCKNNAHSMLYGYNSVLFRTGGKWKTLIVFQALQVQQIFSSQVQKEVLSNPRPTL